MTSWIDLETPDVDAATAFYGVLFGWTFSTATPPDSPFRYAMAQLDGRDAAGIGGPVTATPGWNTYIATEDIEATARRVEATGGRVTGSPAAAGDGGWSASCLDPGGVPFRLWQVNRRLGAQIANTPGAWNFSHLYAEDPARSARFYTEVFGWSFDDLGYATMIRRPGYGDHLQATVDPHIRERQSDPMVPPGFADAIGWLNPTDDLGPRWHVTFTVGDRDHSGPDGALFTASAFTPPEPA